MNRELFALFLKLKASRKVSSFRGQLGLVRIHDLEAGSDNEPIDRSRQLHGPSELVKLLLVSLFLASARSCDSNEAKQSAGQVRSRNRPAGAFAEICARISTLKALLVSITSHCLLGLKARLLRAQKLP